MKEDGSRKITCVAHFSDLLSLHNKDLIEYIVTKDDSIELIDCSPDGIAFKDNKISDDSFGAVCHYDDMHILSNGATFVDAEVNPSLGLSILFPSDDRTKFQIFYGVDFIWNKGCTHVAYFRDPPSDAPPFIKSEVWVDHRAIYSIPRGRKALSWNSDGRTIDVYARGSRVARLDVVSSPTIQSEFVP